MLFKIFFKALFISGSLSPYFAVSYLKEHHSIAILIIEITEVGIGCHESRSLGINQSVLDSLAH